MGSRVENFTKKVIGFGYFAKEVATNLPGAARSLVDVFSHSKETITKITREEEERIYEIGRTQGIRAAEEEIERVTGKKLR